MTSIVSLEYYHGSLELRAPNSDEQYLGQGLIDDCHLVWQRRRRCWRAAAFEYSKILGRARLDFPFLNNASAIENLSLQYDSGGRSPRPYQEEALAAWVAEGCRGVVVLPTGAGKTLVAILAIANRQCSTLVIAPTLDIVRQWHRLLTEAFGVQIGLIGGGKFDLKPLTVCTYDSAHLYIEEWGNRYGLLVFDEVHHLPSPSFQLAAKCSIAPYRLGLTATPDERTTSDSRLQTSEERPSTSDLRQQKSESEVGSRESEVGFSGVGFGRRSVVELLVGPIVYRKDIVEMTGEYLAEYETIQIKVELTADEREEYDEARKVYLDFLSAQGIKIGEAQGFSNFIKRSSKTKEGKMAFQAYRKQKKLAVCASEKMQRLQELLETHKCDHCIVFTLENEIVYEIARQFSVPEITHKTKKKDRIEILRAFAEGRVPAIATSHVLNEGVDVPTANVAIVFSGTGSIRQHVQRLGRILRPQNGKRALLYELVTKNTCEGGTSSRRRKHQAFERLQAPGSGLQEDEEELQATGAGIQVGEPITEDLRGLGYEQVEMFE